MITSLQPKIDRWPVLLLASKDGWVDGFILMKIAAGAVLCLILTDTQEETTPYYNYTG